MVPGWAVTVPAVAVGAKEGVKVSTMAWVFPGRGSQQGRDKGCAWTRTSSIGGCVGVFGDACAGSCWLADGAYLASCRGCRGRCWR